MKEGFFHAFLFPWGRDAISAADLRDLAQAAEELGYASVQVPYHVTAPNIWVFERFAGNKNVLDPTVVLATVASATRSIEIATASIVAPLLKPYFWAKSLATIDQLSEGRLIAGMCVGWWEEEFRIMGVDFEKRAALTDVGIPEIVRLWEGEAGSDGVSLFPLPCRKPRPPIWIGGGLPSLHRAAKWGEWFLGSSPSPEDIRNTFIPRYDKARAATGRSPKFAITNYAAVTENDAEYRDAYEEHSFLVGLRHPSGKPDAVTILGTPERCAQRIEEFVQAGVDGMVLDFQGHGMRSTADAIEQMKRFSQRVMPLVA
ncbi:MAG: LLM class flavin-dependent oxidoreductase [Lautropia sp.]